jgi:disulfide bond formation protein DsbB
VTVDEVTLVFAVLAVVAEAIVAASVLLWLASRASPAAGRLLESARSFLGPDGLALALVVAVVATSGSLYLSEVAHFVPCRLCWAQRFVMYPLVPILGVATWRRRLAVRRFAVPFALVGAAISTYHVLLERFPTLESGACDPKNPCTLIWVERFGYLTIPTMAWSAFTLIATLLALSLPSEES